MLPLFIKVSSKDKSPYMLLEKLTTILDQLGSEEKEIKADYELVRNWFRFHEENLAQDLDDLASVCKLPQRVRRLLTYPVVGNWFLDKMAIFNPQAGHQEQVYSLLRGLTVETRFNNNHMQLLYETPEEYNRRWDEMSALMLAQPTLSAPLHEMMQTISKEIGLAVYEGRIPKSDAYTIDLGHGLVGPAESFNFLTWHFGSLLEHGETEPLDLTLMVVDDQKAQVWYERLIAVGFKDQADQQGFFPDCESALEALRRGHYDVILTDLELGKGKMGGIEFVEIAYDVQSRRGIKPRISVFSYSDEKLREAEERFRGSRWEKPLVFQQVNYNNKARFTAVDFRKEVGYTLK